MMLSPIGIGPIGTFSGSGVHLVTKLCIVAVIRGVSQSGEDNVSRFERRWFGVGLAFITAAALLLGGCGGDDDGLPGDDGGSDAAPTASSDGGGSGSGGSGGSGGADADTMEDLADALAPPNSTETIRFASAEGISVGYESKDSIDSLRDYYDGKIEDLGLAVAGTMDNSELHTWIIEDTDKGVAGGVSVGPSGTGTAIVTINFSPN
jgi:hypothetical protein